MVKWVCQIVTPVRHRALIFDARLFAGNAVRNTLVTGSILSFLRLMCLCVKRRNIILTDKCRSLSDSTLFRADNRTAPKIISPFLLALFFTFVLPLFPNAVPARRCAPGVLFSLMR
jgi:hypothetical protein